MVGVLAALLLVAATPLAASGETDDGDISVNIIEDGLYPFPTPTASTTPAPGGGSGNGGGGGNPGGPVSGGSGATGTGTGTGAVPTNPANPSNDPTVPPGEQVLLFVSGLTVNGHPSVNPFAGGRVTAELEVRNLTTEVFDARTDFRVDDLFGNELAKAPTTQVLGLQPGEVRTVQVDLGEVRIAGLVHAYATITPPDTVAGTALEPVDRDAWNVLPSWYAVGLLVAAVISLGAGAYLRYRGGL
jgi:hypothetical protein